MIKSIKSLILDHWGARHTDIVGLREDLRESKQHLARLEGVVAALRRDIADQHTRCDRLAEGIERIEKRLDLEG